MDGIDVDPSPVEDEPIWGNTVAEEGAEEQDMAEAGRDELYSILNLARDCSSDDVQKSYRRLAALLHPDRHPDQALKEAADGRFQQLSRAYEILSDPQRRVIYDSLGEEGLKTTWEVGSLHKTPAELRTEFERLSRKQMEANLESLVKSKGEFTMTSDARVLFLPDEKRRRLGGPPSMSLAEKLNSVTTRQVFLKHSFATPVNNSTSVLITSQLLARQGVGGGNMLMKLSHKPNSRMNIELGTTLLRPRALSMKMQYIPDSDSFMTLEAPVKTLQGPPPITFVIGRRVYENVTANFSLSTGVWALGEWGQSLLEPIPSSSVSFGLTSDDGWSLNSSTGVMGSQLQASWTRTALHGVKFQIGGAVNSQGGFSTFVSGDRRLTEYTRGGMTLDMAMNGTMSVRLRLSRLGQKITIPIIISSTFEPGLAITFSLLPTVTIIALNQYVILPKRRRKLKSRVAELRVQHAEIIKQKQKEAQDAVDLLAEHVRRVVASEQACDGLIIQDAYYGSLDSISSHIDGQVSPDCLNVTIALQALVRNSQLIIPGGRSKSTLLGFYDCAIGEQKRLRVRYMFKGRAHLIEVLDGAPLAAPLRAHIIA